MPSMAKKVVIVTGALGGIGSATVGELVAAGARVMATDITEARRETLERLGPDGSFFRADVSREAEVAASTAHTLDRHTHYAGGRHSMTETPATALRLSWRGLTLDWLHDRGCGLPVSDEHRLVTSAGQVDLPHPRDRAVQ